MVCVHRNIVIENVDFSGKIKGDSISIIILDCTILDRDICTLNDVDACIK